MTELQASTAFEWVRYPWGQALRCRPLAEFAQHCFTTRRPVIPSGDGAAGDAWESISRAFGLPRHAMVRFRQIHGARVLIIKAADVTRAEVDEWGVADAAVTDSGAVALSVKVADCVPLLIADPRSGAVAAVHAGWRGALSGVVGAAVRELESAFSAGPANLVAAIGPSIGPCCYRVGPELRDRYLEAGQPADLVARWFTPSPPIAARHEVPGFEPASADLGRPLWLNMWSVVSDQLELAGLATGNVHVARLCTSCHRDVLHSYRVDGPAAGRMVGVIRATQRD